MNDVEVVKEEGALSREKEFRSGYLLCHHFFGDETPHTYLCNICVLDIIQIPVSPNPFPRLLPSSPPTPAHRPPHRCSPCTRTPSTRSRGHIIFGVSIYGNYGRQLLRSSLHLLCTMNHMSHPQTLLDLPILRKRGQALCFANNLHIDIHTAGTGQFCGAQNPCKIQCTIIKFYI